ncbi:uncharacterized protein PHALS_11996 [Plasmopara halstedii]|uniref:Uncharacterized protein n=1 Tax=Plasmopara halstedii TaxID=4781 RepID=A0A0P1A560_PLAHL|nr:uncharacterized protein PHALS_11996 [Plasmopara halstedii]CEG35672.1 hypothetical protein PHALS_11996 [Plasmopara halstedii]|eukprot:XP_024572041.1 hypothetical protein PHALS_11996 [Plasmopara halstedii]
MSEIRSQLARPDCHEQQIDWKLKILSATGYEGASVTVQAMGSPESTLYDISKGLELCLVGKVIHSLKRIELVAIKATLSGATGISKYKPRCLYWNYDKMNKTGGIRDHRRFGQIVRI